VPHHVRIAQSEAVVVVHVALASPGVGFGFGLGVSRPCRIAAPNHANAIHEVAHRAMGRGHCGKTPGAVQLALAVPQGATHGGHDRGPGLPVTPTPHPPLPRAVRALDSGPIIVAVPFPVQVPLTPVGGGDHGGATRGPRQDPILEPHAQASGIAHDRGLVAVPVPQPVAEPSAHPMGFVDDRRLHQAGGVAARAGVYPAPPTDSGPPYQGRNTPKLGLPGPAWAHWG
jgi:hypothetical protein